MSWGLLHQNTPPAWTRWLGSHEHKQRPPSGDEHSDLSATSKHCEPADARRNGKRSSALTVREKSTFLDIVLGLATPRRHQRRPGPRGPCAAPGGACFGADRAARRKGPQHDRTVALIPTRFPPTSSQERTNLTKALSKHPLDKLSGGERQRVPCPGTGRQQFPHPR